MEAQTSRIVSAELADPRSIVSAPETGPYLYTFTFRLPFVLGVADSFDHDLNVPGEYVTDGDDEVFGRAPFVRLRILMLKSLIGSSLQQICRERSDTSTPQTRSDDPEGKHLYQQWITLETPAVFFSHEPRWDPGYAFHRSILPSTRSSKRSL